MDVGRADAACFPGEQQLKENPGLVNESAEDKGWFIKIKITNPEELKDSSLFDTPREE